MDTGKANILLVEDDQSLNFIIYDHLEEAGYNVIEAKDGEQAFRLFQENSFDICLLDVMLPKLDGFSLAEKIRARNQMIPILFLTAKSLHEDKLTGFSLGGDDYITKPFSMEELLMRIKVFLKRTCYQPSAGTKKYGIGHFAFYFEELTLTGPQGTKTLTYKEAQLLKYFCEHFDTVLHRSDILINVWGSDDYYLGRSLDVFISRLRKYLKSDTSIRIINLHGIGFRFNAKVIVDH